MVCGFVKLSWTQTTISSVLKQGRDVFSHGRNTTCSEKRNSCLQHRDIQSLELLTAAAVEPVAGARVEVMTVGQENGTIACCHATTHQQCCSCSPGYAPLSPLHPPDYAVKGIKRVQAEKGN